MFVRRSVRTVCAGALGALALSVAAPPVTAAPVPVGAAVQDGPAAPTDRLTVTVADSGTPGADGSFELSCHPAGGGHWAAQEACDRLDGMTRWGRDTFAPESTAGSAGAMCTTMYGGPATARITGTWAGRPVDAAFSRSDGCEIARWDRLVPLLPAQVS
ncbi:SSI family serine proteinase inhibitor [Streptomyces sp. NRRL F-5135]|uniref:SSI family serine proteinase inhibitor n=1 Tax=Streptomyces sp. NRRL F-5135 TaxID=1463858 RepID=UPI0004C6996A|nr:SSI family serine proteinase inhibitor [Streptomyces sp. NRRL F-5135]